jgi:uncharacterized LabA/DUF88 family protein
MRWPGPAPGHLRLRPLTRPAATLVRATFYVDGFNLYHGLKEHTKARAYRWLNLRSLADSLVMPGHVVTRVIYFTSIPPWNVGKIRRHRTYIDALKTVGVEIVEGRFQRDQKLCQASCGQLFDFYSEKLTDVHIATSLIRDGVAGTFDWAYLVSGDADQAPAIKILREMAPTRRVHLVLPPRRDSQDLRKLADACTGPLSHRTVKPHVFPDQITVGSRIIQKPAEW